MHKMLTRIKQSVFMLSDNRDEEDYLEWVDYKSKINFLDTFKWQQRLRSQNIKHI